MMRLLFILLCVPCTVFSQMPDAEFLISGTACVGEQIRIENVSANAAQFEWDFCQGDLEQTPTATAVATIGGNVTSGIDVQFDGSHWFGFVTSRETNSILRLDFGPSLNSSPAVVDLGNMGSIDPWRPIDIRVVAENGLWYGFVFGESTNQITRVDFGAHLDTAPESLATQVVFTSPGAEGSNGFDIVKTSGTEWMIVFTNPFSIGIIKLPTVDALPTGADMLLGNNIVGANGLGDIKIVRDGSDWYAYTPSVSNGKFLRLSFGNSLFSVPTVEDLTAAAFAGLSPYGIDIGFDNGSHVAFVSTLQGNLIRVDLGGNLGLNIVSASTMGTLSVLVNTLKFKLLKAHSRWTAFSVSWDQNRLFRLDFTEPVCGISFSSAMEANPQIRVISAGQKYVSLRAINSEGVDEVTKAIHVSSAQAPSIDFQNSYSCVQVGIPFILSTDQLLTTTDWDFGDGTQTSTENPTHNYGASGTYTVVLTVIASNGCQNYKEKTTSIYDAPTASFLIPPGTICTNNETIFTNTTVDTFDGNLAYEWFVDDTRAGEARNLSYNFNQVGSHSIKLVTSIPGCSSEATQATPSILAGPIVDFYFSGICEQEAVEFVSAISEQVDSQLWDFDDGDTSIETNPDHTFALAGQYNVSLSAQSPNGCQNSTTRSVAIYEKPDSHFSINAPPSSCSGYASQFTDLTTTTQDQVEAWQWDFDDGVTSASQNPSHVFVSAGQYDVELIVTTEHGCSDAIVIPVTVLQSPTLSFNNSTVCANKPVTFSATSDNAIQYYWEIGTAFYETQNASHTFVTPGNHEVTLNVIGPNDCITTLSQVITVPTPIVPFFSFENNCKDNDTKFSVKPPGDDPVVNYNWNFAGEGSSSEQNPTFQFTSLGNRLVGLVVTAASGCVYQTSSIVTVIEPPITNFTFTPDFGVPPQEISFFNASTNATLFNWDFGDGSMSTEQSPVHTFSELGNYTVVLRSANNAGCESVEEKSVSMVAPLPDVDLNLMTITPNGDGTLKIIVTIENKGNTFLRNLPVKLDVSGAVTLETIVSETIAPSSLYNLVMDFAITQTASLEFLCASTTLAGDLHPERNRICQQLQSALAILKPYPNPVKDFLYVEWVAAGSEQVQVVLVDNYGKTIFSNEVSAATGLNSYHIDMRGFRSGNYILRIISQTRSETHRISVFR